MNGIISGGGRRYLEALAREEREAVERLKAMLAREEHPARRAEIEDRIRDVKRSYKEKRKNARWILFGRK